MSDISSTGSIGSAIDYLRQKHAAKFSKNLFNKIDTGGDGSISQTEMESAVTRAGGTQSSADALFSALDPNNTGAVSQSQFLSGFQSLAFSPANGAQLISAQAQSSADPAAGLKQNLFSQLDADGDGSLTQDELEKAVTAAGGTKASADALYSKLDPDGTGSVTAAQFASNLPGAPGAAAQGASATDGNTARDALKALFDANDPATKTAQNLFSQLDANGDGVLTKDELEKAVTAAGGTSDQADALYGKLDPNGTGAVTEQQFTQAVPKHHMHGGHHAPPPDSDDDTTDTADGATSAVADLDSAIDALLKSIAPTGQQPPAMAATSGAAPAVGASADANATANDPVKQLEDAIQALLNGTSGQGGTGQGASGSAMTDATTAMFRSLFNPNMSSPMMTTLIDLQGAGGAAA